MRDFTLKTAELLISKLRDAGYSFVTFSEYLENPERRCVILRHDIDLKKDNALKFAELENKLNIKGSYYFRVIHESFDPELIKKVSDLGHEVGYHYEDMDIMQGDLPAAYEHFKFQLKEFRAITKVKTICMHGSPRSTYDNRDMWKTYNYREQGIIGEPYFDLDFNEVAYFTDTGRMWDGDKYNVRDKVDSIFKYKFHSTFDIIKNINTLPDKVMFTMHPQRWNSGLYYWTKELVMQNFKNIIKENFYVKD